MTGEKLKKLAVEMWGERGWTTALASALRVDRTQVWRYVNGQTNVPGPVQAAMECWIGVFRKTGQLPPAPK